jgi:hypothetical protein
VEAGRQGDGGIGLGGSRLLLLSDAGVYGRKMNSRGWWLLLLEY